MSAQGEQPHIPVRLSMDDPEPMYRQIESQLKDFILAGVLPPGTRLPSIRSLAAQITCSIITARHAYQNLEAEGFIRTRQGMGTVVAEMTEEKILAYRRKTFREAIREVFETGLRMGLTEEELREISEEVLDEVARETRQREAASVRGST
jgi:GntR family transcriptional regulator